MPLRDPVAFSPAACLLGGTDSEEGSGDERSRSSKSHPRTPLQEVNGEFRADSATECDRVTRVCGEVLFGLRSQDRALRVLGLGGPRSGTWESRSIASSITGGAIYDKSLALGATQPLSSWRSYEGSENFYGSRNVLAQPGLPPRGFVLQHIFIAWRTVVARGNLRKDGLGRMVARLTAQLAHSMVQHAFSAWQTDQKDRRRRSDAQQAAHKVAVLRWAAAAGVCLARSFGAWWTALLDRAYAERTVNIGIRIGSATAQLLVLRALAAWQSATVEAHAADFVDEAWTREDDAREKAICFVGRIRHGSFKFDAFAAWCQGAVESRLVKMARNLQFDVETATAWVDDRGRHGAVLAAGLRRDLIVLRVLTSWRLEASRVMTWGSFRNSVVISQILAAKRRAFMAWCSCTHHSKVWRVQVQRMDNAFFSAGKCLLGIGIGSVAETFCAWITSCRNTKWQREKEAKKSTLAKTLMNWKRSGDPQLRAAVFLAWRLIVLSRHRSLRGVSVILGEWRNQVRISSVHRQSSQMKRMLMIQSQELMWDSESFQLLHFSFLDWWAVWFEGHTLRKASEAEHTLELATDNFATSQFISLLRICLRIWQQQATANLPENLATGNRNLLLTPFAVLRLKIIHSFCTRSDQNFHLFVVLALRLWCKISQVATARTAGIAFALNRVAAEQVVAVTSMSRTIVFAWKGTLQQAKRQNAEATAVLGFRGLALQLMCQQILGAWYKMSGFKKLNSEQDMRLEKTRALFVAQNEVCVALLRWRECLKRSQRQCAEKAAILGLRGLNLQVLCKHTLSSWYKVSVLTRLELVQIRVDRAHAQRDELACQLLSLSLNAEDVIVVRAAFLSWKVFLQKYRQSKAIKHVTREATRFMEHARQCQSNLMAQSMFFAWRAESSQAKAAKHASREATRFMEHAQQCQANLMTRLSQRLAIRHVFFNWCNKLTGAQLRYCWASKLATETVCRVTWLCAVRLFQGWRAASRDCRCIGMFQIMCAWKTLVLKRRHAQQMEQLQGTSNGWKHAWMESKISVEAKSKLGRLLSAWCEAVAFHAGSQASGRLKAMCGQNWADRKCEFACLGALSAWKIARERSVAAKQNSSKAYCLESCMYKARQESTTRGVFAAWRIVCMANCYANVEIKWQIEFKTSEIVKCRYEAQTKSVAFTTWYLLVSTKQTLHQKQMLYQKQCRALTVCEKIASLAWSAIGAACILETWHSFVRNSAAKKAFQRIENRALSASLNLAVVTEMRIDAERVFKGWSSLAYDSKAVQRIESLACLSIGAARVLAAWRFVVHSSLVAQKIRRLADESAKAVAFQKTRQCFSGWCSTVVYQLRMASALRERERHETLISKLRHLAWRGFCSVSEMLDALLTFRVLKSWDNMTQNHTYRDRVSFLLTHVQRLEVRESRALLMFSSMRGRIVLRTVLGAWQVQSCQSQLCAGHLRTAYLVFFLHWRLQTSKQMQGSKQKSRELRMVQKTAASKGYRRLAIQAIVVAWRETLLDLQAARRLRHEALEVQLWARAALRRLAGALRLAGHHPTQSHLLFVTLVCWHRCSRPFAHTRAYPYHMHEIARTSQTESLSSSSQGPQTLWSPHHLTKWFCRWKGALMQTRMEEAEREAERQKHQAEQLLGIICLHKARERS